MLVVAVVERISSVEERFNVIQGSGSRSMIIIRHSHCPVLQSVALVPKMSTKISETHLRKFMFEGGFEKQQSTTWLFPFTSFNQSGRIQSSGFGVGVELLHSVAG